MDGTALCCIYVLYFLLSRTCHSTADSYFSHKMFHETRFKVQIYPLKLHVHYLFCNEVHYEAENHEFNPLHSPITPVSCSPCHVLYEGGGG